MQENKAIFQALAKATEAPLDLTKNSYSARRAISTSKAMGSGTR